MIKIAKTSSEIKSCFPCFQVLRPHIDSVENFTEQVLRQKAQGYQIAYLCEDAGKISACIGYRFMETLAWGKIIYVDDLITLPETRGKGFAKALINYVKQIAHQEGIEQIHLDSGYTRHAAHKIYFKTGFILNSHHFSLILNNKA